MESTTNQLENNKEKSNISEETLKKYYLEFYPSKLIIDWLCRKDIKQLKFREFSFQLTEDKLLRYQSFKSLNEFRRRISYLNPLKIDLGGIYNIEPRSFIEHKANKELNCEEKELVFDIDLSDYDNVRRCCQKNKICSKCWKYLIAGAKILERILKEDFGFEKIFFVFSGRRGIHCWVSDKRACLLNKQGRIAVGRYINYDNLIDNNFDSKNNKIRRNFAEPVYPSYLSSVSLIKNDFYTIIKEQDLLNDPKLKTLFKNIISIYFSIIDMDYINEVLEKNFDSLKKIKKIVDFLQKGENILKTKNKINYCYADACLNEFIMTILYPRLDVNVTTQMVHLLKSPFCVHPKTGYISVPMSIELIEKFSLDKIPKVNYLIYDEEDNEDKEYILQYEEFFKNFVENLNKNNNNEN